MPSLRLHHVSIVVRDLERSLAFYCDILGLQPLPRPDFPVRGAWLSCGDRQVHLVVHDGETFRQSDTVDNNDGHFALNTDDFEATVTCSRLTASASTPPTATLAGSSSSEAAPPASPSSTFSTRIEISSKSTPRRHRANYRTATMNSLGKRRSTLPSAVRG